MGCRGDRFEYIYMTVSFKNPRESGQVWECSHETGDLTGRFCPSSPELLLFKHMSQTRSALLILLVCTYISKNIFKQPQAARKHISETAVEIRETEALKRKKGQDMPGISVLLIGMMSRLFVNQKIQS